MLYLFEANKRVKEQIESLKRRQVLWSKKHESDLAALVAQYDELSKIDGIVDLRIDDVIGDDDVEIQFSWNDKTNQLEPKIINPDLQGEQQDCPKGEQIKKYILPNKGFKKFDLDSNKV